MNHFRFQDPSRICIAIYACVTLHNMQNNYRNGSYQYDTTLNCISMQEVPDDEGDNNNIEAHETPANAEILMQMRILEHFASKKLLLMKLLFGIKLIIEYFRY